MLTYFLIGMAVGCFTGVPIGPANLAVIDAAYRHTMRRAIGVALGAALGDLFYAALGILGVGPLVVSYEAVPPILFCVSGVVLIVYGALTARAHPVSPADEHAPRPAVPSKQMRSGVTVGLALIILNPAAIVTWVLVVAPYLVGADRWEGVAASIGVPLGSFAWFYFVAYLTTHGKRLMGGRAIWITRVVGIVLIGYGLFSIARALKYWFF